MKKIFFAIWLVAISVILLQCEKGKTKEEILVKKLEIEGDLSFGAAEVGTKLTKTFIVNNTGTASLNVSSISCPQGFSVNWAGGSIAKEIQKEITVTFAPTEVKLYNGEIVIKSDIGSGTHSVQVSGTGVSAAVPKLSVSRSSLPFGNVTVGSTATETFTISNTGNAPLTINITSSNNVFFANYNRTIVAGGSQVITVAFSPTVAQTYSGQFNITSDGGSATVSLSGTGVNAAVPKLSVSPTSLNFGNIPYGNAWPLKVKITNTGNAPLVIKNIYLSPVNGLIFRVSTSWATMTIMNPNTSQEVVVTFSPLTAQIYTDSLVIETNAGSESVALYGVGVR